MAKNKLPLFLPVRSVVFLLIFVIGAAVTGREVDDISNWWSVVATAVNILTILMLVLLAKSMGQTYGELICYQKGRTKPKQIILICILILSVGMTGMYLAGFICYGVILYAAPMMIAPIPNALAVINALLLPVTTAFAEDGLYLGCGVNNLKNKTAAILVPAFFFALQHCFIPTLFDVRYLIYRFLSFLPLTVVLCWYYYKKRDPVPIMIGHALIDLATVVWIILTSFIPGFYDKMCSM
ncbi:MAG: CPBP family intramembrane metalloprotease [Ruminococcus sp.]|nr:CPBP family intramembrane metalloprotease [Ruminococcus sp.]